MKNLMISKMSRKLTFQTFWACLESCAPRKPGGAGIFSFDFLSDKQWFWLEKNYGRKILRFGVKNQVISKMSRKSRNVQKVGRNRAQVQHVEERLVQFDRLSKASRSIPPHLHSCELVAPAGTSLSRRTFLLHQNVQKVAKCLESSKKPKLRSAKNF